LPPQFVIGALTLFGLLVIVGQGSLNRRKMAQATLLGEAWPIVMPVLSVIATAVSAIDSLNMLAVFCGGADWRRMKEWVGERQGSWLLLFCPDGGMGRQAETSTAKRVSRQCPATMIEELSEQPDTITCVDTSWLFQWTIRMGLHIAGVVRTGDNRIMLAKGSCTRSVRIV
jgi:hypothetical protein